MSLQHVHKVRQQTIARLRLSEVWAGSGSHPQMNPELLGNFEYATDTEYETGKSGGHRRKSNYCCTHIGTRGDCAYMQNLLKLARLALRFHGVLSKNPLILDQTLD
jgi:hypothetical protein